MGDIKQGDREILHELKALADRLGEDGSDALLDGQFAHLRARIDALIEITQALDEH